MHILNARLSLLLQRIIRVFGAFGKNLSHEDIEGSTQWEVAVNLLHLDQRLDGLNISDLEANSTPYLPTHLAMPE